MFKTNLNKTDSHFSNQAVAICNLLFPKMTLHLFLLVILNSALVTRSIRPCSPGCAKIMYDGFEKIEILIRDLEEKTTLMGKPVNKTEKRLPRDCYDVKMQGNTSDGVYTILPQDSGRAFEVYCELSGDDSGWLVFQRRTSGSRNFYRSWPEYQRGFGSLTGEFWLGNEQLHRLTSQRRYQLQVDLEDFEENVSHAVYDDFSVDSATDFYTLHLTWREGPAGDSLSRHNGQGFSTRDLDVDLKTGSCAQMFNGGWWFADCLDSNLNGLYQRGRYPVLGNGIVWKTWKGYYYSLKSTKMKIRPES